MKDPVLVSSVDGVGTKLKVDIEMGTHELPGQDIVNHCCDDILVQGARPLFFLDYVATGRLEPGVMDKLVAGMAKACRENDLVLIGGETAEMPGFYGPGDYDISGTIVGVVERENIIDGKKIKPGTIILGLRNATDYIIGSPAEIPGEGAPYEEIVPALFEKNTFCTSIIDLYYNVQNGNLPLSAVKTSAMDQLASATRYALDMVQAKIGNGYADTQGLIHYGYSASSIQFHQEYNLFYDAGDFFRSQLSESDYQQWKRALDQAVVEKRFAEQWRTCMTWRYIYSDFEMTEEKYHGVSMYIPQDPNTEYGKYYARNNEDIKQLKWYQSVGW